MTGKKKPLVVITRKLPDQVETRMRELFDARLNVDDQPMTQPELVAAVREADIDIAVNLEVIGAKDYELSRVATIAAESRGYLHACLKACGAR